MNRAFLQQITASEEHCQQEGPNCCGLGSGCRVSCSVNWWLRWGRREVLVVNIRNYILSTCIGLLARRLDLVLGELEAKRPIVS